MKLVEILNILCCAMCCTQFAINCLHFLMVTNVSSMPTDLVDYFDDENPGRSDDYNFSTSQMIACVSECNDTDFLIDKNFLVKWLRLDSQHSISKLSVAANNLKDNTQYLPVSETSATDCNMYMIIIYLCS